MSLIRLDKLLVQSGQCSRKEARQWIASGRVTVNGLTITVPDTKVEEKGTDVALDGILLSCERYVYVMLHKPVGVLTATEDSAQATVLDLLEERFQKLSLFPVGRLDKDTSGLLLLCNDGDWAHRLLSPKNHVPRRYLAEVDGELSETDIEAFREGLLLKDGTRCLSAGLEILSARRACVEIREGKYHQVRRMFAACGKTVLTLKRLSVGSLALDGNLAPGQSRPLTKEETELVFE